MVHAISQLREVNGVSNEKLNMMQQEVVAQKQLIDDLKVQSKALAGEKKLVELQNQELNDRVKVAEAEVNVPSQNEQVFDGVAF